MMVRKLGVACFCIFLKIIYFFDLMILKTIITVFLFMTAIANANNLPQIPLVVDAEIEDFLKEISKPLIVSANLKPKDIRFFLVNDSRINAFVMNGQNIFVNLGVLTTFDTPDAVLGIIAHELGHI